MSTNTGAIKLDLFKKLMASLQDSTKDSMHPAVPPVLAMVRDETKDLMEKLEIATKKISIDELKDESFVWYQDGLATKTRKDSKKEDTRDKTLVVDTNDLTATTGAVFNWLIKTLNVCVEKLNSHSIVLDAMLIHHEQDVVKLKDENNKVEEKCGELKEENEKVVVEVEKLKEEKVNVETRCERLEVEKDEVQQRGMKGNLIISTNTRGGRASGFQRLPPSGPNMEVESELSMVLRGVNDHTGVYFEHGEVQDFHANGRDRANPTSYTLRIWNRRPGSNWQALREGMRTWTKPGTDSTFNSDINVRVNYQLTRTRALLGKQVRETRALLVKEKILKKHEVIMKYNHDDNGVLRVKTVKGEGRGKPGRWEVVTNIQQLTTLVQSSYSFTIPAGIINPNNS